VEASAANACAYASLYTSKNHASDSWVGIEQFGIVLPRPVDEIEVLNATTFTYPTGSEPSGGM
jgi:hypothetical protein